MSLLVEDELAALFRTGDLRAFAAELDLPGESGTSRRIQVRGDGLVQVDGNAQRGGSDAPASIGRWEGRASAAELKTLAGACGAVRPDTRPPEKPGVSALRLQVGRAGVFAALTPDVVKKLEPAFELLAQKAATKARLSLEWTVLQKAEAWSGELRLAASGSEPVVLQHPAKAAAVGLLTLARTGGEARPEVPVGDDWVVLSPGESLALPFRANRPAGQGPARLRWVVRTATREPFFSTVRAPIGLLLTLPVGA